jgi:predicted O-methyltransferase YrrM
LAAALEFRFVVSMGATRTNAPDDDRSRNSGRTLMATTIAGERQRRLIHDYFGRDAHIRILREAPVFDAPVFVVDFDRGLRHYRTLGSVGGFASTIQITEQSSMDLMYPAHLVFHYERLMSLAFALVERPVTALLLGVGGAAMWRFVRAYLPECATTLVDSDEDVVAVARRWFYLSQPVTLDDAGRYLAGTRHQFDVILVDLYDAHGPAAATDAAFWMRCLDALAPGGCLATNWADFASNRKVKPIAELQQEVARARGLDCCFATRRGFQDNLVQYLPTGQMRGIDALKPAHDRFARERRLPDRGRGTLEDCLITSAFPLDLG